MEYLTDREFQVLFLVLTNVLAYLVKSPIDRMKSRRSGDRRDSFFKRFR